MNILVTVGSTTFDELSRLVLNDEILEKLNSMGYRRMTLQHGRTSSLPSGNSSVLEIIRLTYLPDMSQAMANADLIISHAGAGTVLEALKTGSSLIIVPNETLMDNHQIELAEKLGSLNYCTIAKANIESMLQALSTVHAVKPVAFAEGQKSALQAIIREELSCMH